MAYLNLTLPDRLSHPFVAGGLTQPNFTQLVLQVQHSWNDEGPKKVP
jgi:hypothetical protein